MAFDYDAETPLGEIFSKIPHRPPFLWVDRIIESGPELIVAEKKIPEDLELFDGHYPGNPLLPGVLTCEAIFQTGALLLAEMLKQGVHAEQSPGEQNKKVPVLTKIRDARFKRPVLPGETIRLQVRLVDMVSSVCILKGSAEVDGKVAVKTEFACALVAL
jgi:3-hydroxyacyl-[acyl-carrier-protein] dehydratase